MKPTIFEENPAGVKKVLDSLLRVIASEQERLDGSPSHTIEELVDAYAAARDLHDLMDEVRKKMYHVMNNYKEVVLPLRMAEQGMTSASTERWRVTLSSRVNCSMLDADACIQWLRDNKHGDLVKETVNAQTLGAFAKVMLEKENQELPDNLFKTTPSVTTSLTARK